jgi:hypothetical protein
MRRIFMEDNARHIGVRTEFGILFLGVFSEAKQKIAEPLTIDGSTVLLLYRIDPGRKLGHP